MISQEAFIRNLKRMIDSRQEKLLVAEGSCSKQFDVAARSSNIQLDTHIVPVASTFPSLEEDSNAPAPESSNRTWRIASDPKGSQHPTLVAGKKPERLTTGPDNG